MRGRVGLTSTGSVRQQHVSVETVALVTPVSVHAPVLTRPRLQAALVQICGEREGVSVRTLSDRQTGRGRGSFLYRVKLARGQR